MREHELVLFSFLIATALIPLPLSGQAQAPGGDGSLAAACAAVGTGTLMLTSTWNAVPDGTNLACKMHATAGGKIQPASGAKVILSGPFDGDATQHFDLSLGGNVAVGAAFSANTLYPQWFGATPDGRTATDGAVRSGSAVLTSSTLHFTSADTGKYVSVSGAGASGSGLGTTVASVTNATTAILAAASSANVTGATVTLGTNNYASIRATAAAAAWKGVRSVEFPPGMYVIGQHKSFARSYTDVSQDIQWTDLSQTTISGYGATIYIDASFYQSADASGGKSNENTITPFLIQHATGVTVQGFTVLGNKDLIVRASGVKSESLTSFCVTVGGTAVSSNYTLRDMTCTQPQTDCYFFGYNSTVTDLGATGSNLICTEPARGNFSVGNINGLHLSGVHGSNAGAGPYGGFQPFHCVNIEPNLRTTDNIHFDGASTCTNDIGWEFSVSDPTKVNHVTVSDSTFSWDIPTKQQGFNCNASNCLIELNTFNIGHSASANNLVAASGGPSSGVVSQVWRSNTIKDTTSATMTHAALIAGTDPDGTLNPVDIIDNTFNLNGLGINARNLQEFSGNHIYWFTTGLEPPGASVIVNLEGTQNIHDNDYDTNLTVTGKRVTTNYNWSSGTPVVANEKYLTSDHYTAACSYCSGTSLVNR